VSNANQAALAKRLKQLTDPDPALVALARTLARTLDEGAGLAVAAVSREYRQTLDALTPEDADDDGPIAEWTGLSP
jgi:phytoene/squalene synthetase